MASVPYVVQDGRPVVGAVPPAVEVVGLEPDPPLRAQRHDLAGDGLGGGTALSTGGGRRRAALDVERLVRAPPAHEASSADGAGGGGEAAGAAQRLAVGLNVWGKIVFLQNFSFW